MASEYYGIINAQKKKAKTACIDVCDKLELSAKDFRESATQLSNAASTCDLASSGLSASSTALQQAADKLDLVSSLLKQYHNEMIILLNIAEELLE